MLEQCLHMLEQRLTGKNNTKNWRPWLVIHDVGNHTVCAKFLSPLFPRHTLKLRLFKPQSASGLQSFLAWLSGMPAEFSDPRFPSYGEGREGELVVSLHLPNIRPEPNIQLPAIVYDV